MMDPTCSDTVVTTVQEAHCVMYAVLCGVKPLIHRRPCNEDERSSIRSGAVFVWEEGSGIERWTDRREWGDSRSREDFLFYTEGPKAGNRPSESFTLSNVPIADPLVKQTYTAQVDRGDGLRKWHLIAYYTEGTKHLLRRVCQDPELANIHVPAGVFKQSRLPKSRRMRDRAPSGAESTGGGSGGAGSRMLRTASVPVGYHDADPRPSRPVSPQEHRRQRRQDQNWPYPHLHSVVVPGVPARELGKLALPPLEACRAPAGDGWLPRHPVDEQVLSRLHIQTVA